MKKLAPLILSFMMIFITSSPVYALQKNDLQKSFHIVLDDSEMEKLVGGSAVGQILITDPDSGTDVSGKGTVSYKVQVYDLNATVSMAIFIAHYDGTTTEIYNSKISDPGTYSGTFSSSYVETVNDVMIAELLNTSGDASDPCDDGTETIYARAMIDLDGDGE